MDKLLMMTFPYQYFYQKLTGERLYSDDDVKEFYAEVIRHSRERK